MKRIENFQWDMQKLQNPEGWLEEAKRAQILDIPHVGIFGVACPKCWLPISSAGEPTDKNCQCGDKYDREETLTALGLENCTAKVKTLPYVAGGF